ncbi:hypothetical protein [Corallococcus macrosporus]|uniref:Uncharacterized protein n=2 Tax=Myxococcaceae TaxID=31 RepID=F8CID3_MYXFH|nr:hypothetical protein [Corallococcus macrosporus]AEI63792.1 hypothetical protein LILAB_09405 [Corallococcus macrosporus]AEI63802.1 hypothetical protein LILAB_09455 [Corallococcus macrosporus]ATB51448.1 hypothetical protein MYMAC_007111 [Corallococcus macrosporus DSM 14697]
MAISKRGLVDRVKEVAVQAGTRGARVLLGTAVVTARGVADLQAKLRGTPVRSRAKTAANGARRTAKAARGVIESGKPAKAPARRKSPAAKVASAAGAQRQVGRKAVPGQTAAAKRGTAKQARPVKAKRGQKHRH